MQPRDARELLAYRLGGASRSEAYGVEVRRAGGENPYNQQTQKFFHDGTAPVFRQNDEPGVWRWFHNAEPIPLEQLKDLFAGDPALEAELRERRLLEDRERALDVLKGVVTNGAAKVIEQRGAYALTEAGDGAFMVNCSGVPLMPGPAGESIARAVFDAVAAPIVVPAGESLAAELGA